MGVRDSSSAEPGFKLCSPAGKPVEQRYVDEDGNAFERDALGRATVDEDGNYTQVDPTAIAAAKASALPLNQLTLTAHPKSDLDQYLYPSGKHQGYVFEPKWRNTKGKIVVDQNNVEAYDLIRATIASADCGFVSEANVQNSEALFRIGLYQGLVCIQRQSVPSELHQFEVEEPKVKPVLQRKLRALAASMVEEFKFDTYVNRVTERLEALKDEGFSLEAVQKLEPPSVDFDDVLDSFIAGRQ